MGLAHVQWDSLRSSVGLTFRILSNLIIFIYRIRSRSIRFAPFLAGQHSSRVVPSAGRSLSSEFERAGWGTSRCRPLSPSTNRLHSQMALLRIPFRKAYDGPKILYKDRKARFGRHRFVVEGGVAQRVSCVLCVLK